MRSLLIVLFVLFPISAFAFSSGIGAASLSANGCATCHSGGAGSAVGSVSFPGTMYVGMPYSITVGVDNASQLAGGFNLRVNNGEFAASPGAGARRLSPGEATHSSANALPATWVLTWTPASAGDVEYLLWSNSVNLNGSSSGDSPAVGILSGTVPVQLRPDGMGCDVGGQCDSGFCANGMCCSSSCDGECEMCVTGACVVVDPEPAAGPTACCMPGFRWTGSVCEDIDECALGIDECYDDPTDGATCVNSAGSYDCECPAGLTGDGFENGTQCGTTCGDGFIDANEECDDGLMNGEATSCCSTSCQLVEGCCNVDADCDDQDACTTDTCSGPGGTCNQSPITGCCLQDSDCLSSVCSVATCDLGTNRCSTEPIDNCCEMHSDCDDGNACTTNSCDFGTGQCATEVNQDCCLTDGDCDDGNQCTSDLCDPDSNTCMHTDIPSCCRTNEDCDDGDSCTVNVCLVELGQCNFEVVEMCGTGPGPDPDPSDPLDPSDPSDPSGGDEGCGCASAGATNSVFLILLGLIGVRWSRRR